MSTYRSFFSLLRFTSFATAIVFVTVLSGSTRDIGDLARHSGNPGSDIVGGWPALDRELATMVSASERTADPAGQRRTASMSGVKIAVKEEGMYRVSRAELQAAGFPVDSDTSRWRLFMNGNEQAIIVGEGGQYVDFYGRGIDTFEADTRYYFLVLDTVAGKRMTHKVLNSIGGNVVSNNYRFTVQRKERRSYIADLRNGDVDNYFGLFISSDFSVPERFTLRGVDPQGADALINIDLQGYLTAPHRVAVVINGVNAGVLTGNGTEHFGGTFVVPAASLLEGTNTITLTAALPNDFSFFDAVTVVFSRRYAADQNRIAFAATAYRRASVTGFTSPNVRVFDTTYDGEPQLIANPEIVQEGGTFTVRMPANRPAVFFAVEDTGLLHSPSVTRDDPSALASPDNAADMVIISYSSPEFLEAAENWASYRRSPAGGAFDVKVIDVEDVFDEFSYGVHSAAAIRDFLSYAHTNWRFAGPDYALLLGDASYDRRNYEGQGYWDLVPSRNVVLSLQETGSDDALADIDDDGLPEIPIGRIPARNASQLTAALNKTIAFEMPSNQNLFRGALFAYHFTPSQPAFENMSRQLRGELPRSVPALFIPRAGGRFNRLSFFEEPMAGQQDLIDGINRGNFIVNYCGSASGGVWSGMSYFAIGDVQSLTNADKPSIITALGNFTGYFMSPGQGTLCEALIMAPNGGSAANWGASTITTYDTQLAIGTEFYRLLATGNELRIGDLIKASKSPIAGDPDGYAWNLLGDPALKVR